MPNHNNPDPERVDTGRLGGLTSWTYSDAKGERHQRMEAVRQNAPASDDYWARDLGFIRGLDGEWTPQQRAEISTKKKLYFARLRRASVAEIKRLKAAKLQAQAAAIQDALRQGVPIRNIADDVGVSPSTVSNIKK
jgi:hypothetical protein